MTFLYSVLLTFPRPQSLANVRSKRSLVLASFFKKTMAGKNRNVTESFSKAMEDVFRTLLRAIGVHPWMECPSFSNSDAKTWDEGAAMWIDEHVTLVIVETRSNARHASRVGLQRSAMEK